LLTINILAGKRRKVVPTIYRTIYSCTFRGGYTAAGSQFFTVIALESCLYFCLVTVAERPFETMRIGHGFGQFLNKTPKGNNGSVMALGFSSLKTPIASLVRLTDLAQVACVIASSAMAQAPTSWTESVQGEGRQAASAAFCCSFIARINA
jgi:hypothetical protein